MAALHKIVNKKELRKKFDEFMNFVLCVFWDQEGPGGPGMNIEELEWVKTIDNVVSVFPQQVMSKIVVSYILESEIEFDHTKTEYVETNSRQIKCLQFSVPYISIPCKLPLMHSKKSISFIHRGSKRCDMFVKLHSSNDSIWLQNKFNLVMCDGSLGYFYDTSFVCIDFNLVLKQIITTQIHVDAKTKTYFKSIAIVIFNVYEIEKLLLSCVPHFEVGWFPQEIELVPEIKLDESWQIKNAFTNHLWHVVRHGNYEILPES
jgi:hypothetical protein